MNAKPFIGGEDRTVQVEEVAVSATEVTVAARVTSELPSGQHIGIRFVAREPFGAAMGAMAVQATP